jgi:hypothetical protein
LAVVHVRLGWVIAQHPIHDDDLLSVKRLVKR